MRQIVAYHAICLGGVWKPHRRKITAFTEETAPKLHTWIVSGSSAAYLCFDNEMPTPAVPGENALDPKEIPATAAAAVRRSGCNCKRSSDIKLPDTQCWVCAEKHFGTAYSLYTEIGYRSINKLHCIGEIASSAKHLASTAPEFAEKLRTLRHDIQNGLDIPSTRWDDLAEEFYTLKEKGE